MIIQNLSLANELYVNGALNPKFFGVTSTPSESKTVTVTPAPVTTKVTVTPASIVQDGVTVNFPPYTQEVTFQPPAVNVVIPSTGGSLSNVFESVGVTSGNGQFRLVALVRPNVVAGARHYNNPPFAPYIGLVVTFANGEQAKIVDVAFTRDDFECYRLDRNITGVRPAVIASLEANAYSGREIIMFGLAEKTRPVAGKTFLKYAFGGAVSWVGTVANKSTSPCFVQAGDSGSPVFIVSGGVVKYFGSLGSISLTETKVNIACPHSAEIGAL